MYGLNFRTTAAGVADVVNADDDINIGEIYLEEVAGEVEHDFFPPINRSSVSTDEEEDAVTYPLHENNAIEESKLNASPVSLSNGQIVQELANIYSEKGMSLSCLGQIAKLISKLGHDIPTDPRTILKTRRSAQQNQSFQHFSLKEGLMRKLKKGIFESQENCLEIQVNIDGTPVFKTNSIDLWPILCRIVNCKDSTPFVVSIFAGKGKPPCVEEYLAPFITELIQLEKDGIQLNNVNYTVHLSSIVCDAPARQYVKCIKGHCGYEGCERCCQHGVYRNEGRCITFPEMGNVTLQTDSSFRKKTKRNHHVGSSPFLQLNIDMITSFPLDYMHLVLLGVFKRMLLLWTGQWNKTKGHIHKLGLRERQNINHRLMRIRKSYPKEFPRITTSLFHVKQLKAVELRTLLLYTGPYVFKGVLSEEKYTHFLYLHLAIRILASNSMVKEYSGLANDCLKYFAHQFGKIYGKNHLVYNVHSLTHLAGDCMIHGPLDSFSAFPFETYLGRLKKLIRSPNRPLAQIVNRISELNYISTLSSGVSSSILNEKCLTRSGSLEKNIEVGTKINSFYVTKNGLVVKLLKFTATHITGRVFMNLKSFYNNPFKSKQLNIFQSMGLSTEIHKWSRGELQLSAKCWVLPTGKGCFIIPLLHHNN